MKYTIDKEAFDALTEDAKKEYNLDGETATLVIEGGPDIARLEKKANLAEEHRKKAEDARDAAEDNLKTARAEFSKAGGNADKIKELEAKHTAELEKVRKERESEKAEALAKSDQEMVNAEATKFASENFTIPGLVSDQIAKRLNVEEVGGKRVVRVLDADGNPSALGINDLHKEFLDNKEFAPIIKANVGAGGGASPAAGGGADHKGKENLSLTEKVAMKKDNPTQYAALFPEN